MGGSKKEDSSGGSGDHRTASNKKKKNILQKAAEKSVVLRTIKGVGEKLEDAARPYNTKRRKEFISKYNTSVPATERLNLTDEEIGSAKGLSTLRDVGYKTVTDMSSGGGGDNQDKSMEQPKVASQMDNTGVKSKLVVADKTAPTTTEMTEDERMIGVKRKGRRVTTLTDIDEKKKPTLSKKVLLG